MLARVCIASACFGFSVLAASAFAYDRNPVGERADYQLDRSASRTSSVIQDGTLALSVTQHLPDQAGGPAFAARLDYDFRVAFAGRQQGAKSMAVPAAYFTPEFMADLRETGRYESPNFKVVHLGYGDAQNLDGLSYEHCDRIRIYDIKDIEVLPFAAVAVGLLEAAAMATGIDDLSITAHIYEGEPVLGAVKLDIAAKYNGMSIKAGADLRRS